MNKDNIRPFKLVSNQKAPFELPADIETLLYKTLEQVGEICKQKDEFFGMYVIFSDENGEQLSMSCSNRWNEGNIERTAWIIELLSSEIRSHNKEVMKYLGMKVSDE